MYDYFWNVDEYDFDSCFDFLNSEPIRDGYIIAASYWIFKSFYTKLARNKFKPTSKRECLPDCTHEAHGYSSDKIDILNAMMYFYLRLTDPYNGLEQTLDTTVIDSIVFDTAMFKAIMNGISNKIFFLSTLLLIKFLKWFLMLVQLQKEKNLH